MPDEVDIRDVWADNLEEAFQTIRNIVQTHPYVAMDTEFPGVVARPVGTFRNTSDYQYQTLKLNCDMLKIIQLGLTFSDAQGVLAPGCATWQFHFKFDLEDDIYAHDSIELLEKAGLDFERHKKEGIDPNDYAELLTSSGLSLTEDVKWISFHSYYDFGYLLRVATALPLPSEESIFFELLRQWFPAVYDVKYLMKSTETLKGGLNKVAESLDVSRIGPSHQAGSDSLLTSAAFFKMRQRYFEDQLDDSKYLGVLYGLGQGGSSSSSWEAAL